MTIGPTIAGGLKLVPEADQDWLILLEIANDGDSDLSRRFASLMDEDSMWEEIVVPELEQEFTKQRLDVMMVVVKAKGGNEEAIHIDKEGAETWYGALNQARLALESKHKFGPRELNSPKEIKDPEARSAYFRNDFYSTIQSLLLRYVMVD